MTEWRILVRNRLPDHGAGFGPRPSIRQEYRPEPCEPLPNEERWAWLRQRTEAQSETTRPRQLLRDVFRRGLLSAGWKLLAVAGRPSPDALAQRGVLVFALLRSTKATA